MSRKSKHTIYRERLEEISLCPVDIFERIEPSDELFSLLKSAEDGDISATRELTQRLFELCKNDTEPISALSYFAKKGTRAKDRECALILLRYIDTFNEAFDHFEDVLALIGDDRDEESEQIITRIRVKVIIAKANNNADYEDLTDRLSRMYDEYSAYARIYVASQRLINTGCIDKEKTEALAKALDIPSITHLPVFTGGAYEGKNEQTYALRECEALKFTFSLINMDEWRDFWLRAIYEYAENLLGGNLISFIGVIYDAISSRPEYQNKKIHRLAVKKYLMDTANTVKRDEYLRLERECRFEGCEIDISTDEARDRMIKEAVYTSSKEVRQCYRITSRLGNLIIHKKNRYSLSATLTDHMKRGNRHLWDICLSVKTDSDTLPQISVGVIADRKNEVTRGGISLEREKKLSQIICSSEMLLEDKVYPLELDLILDISYVSTTKCENCEIKIKDHERIGEFLVMYGSLSVF